MSLTDYITRKGVHMNTLLWKPEITIPGVSDDELAELEELEAKANEAARNVHKFFLKLYKRSREEK